MENNVCELSENSNPEDTIPVQQGGINNKLDDNDNAKVMGNNSAIEAIQLVNDTISEKIYRNEFTTRNNSNSLLEKMAIIVDKMTPCIYQFKDEIVKHFKNLCEKEMEMEKNGEFLPPTDVDGNKLPTENQRKYELVSNLFSYGSEALEALLSSISIFGEVKMLLDSHETIRMEYDKLRLDHNDLLLKYSKEISDHNETVIQNQERITKLKLEGSDAQTALANTNQKYWQLRRDFDLLKTRVEEDNAKNEKLLKTYKESEEKAKILIEDLNVENTKLQQELKMETTLAKGAKEEINKAIAEKNVAVDELKELQYKYKRMKESVLDLKNSLRKSKALSSSQMLGSGNYSNSQVNSLIGSIITNAEAKEKMGLSTGQISISVSSTNTQKDLSPQVSTIAVNEVRPTESSLKKNVIYLDDNNRLLTEEL